MKATFQTTYGSPNVLNIKEVETPTIGDTEVLIQVHASPVTQGDRRLRAADFPGFTKLFGRLMTGVFRPRHPIPGTMFAGKIVAIGASVTRFAVGEDLFGSSLDGGAHAQYLALPEDGAFARMPSNLDYDEAAAVPYGAGTALHFLQHLGAIQSGQRVLIIGASGEVGRFAVQLADHFGAEVTGVCSRDHEHVRNLGAKHTIDYRTEDFTQNGQRYDIIFDTSGTARYDRCKNSLTDDGRYLSLYVTLRLLFYMLTTSLFGSRKAICGVSLGDHESTDQLRALVEQGAIRPIIDSRYPLDRAVQANARVESGKTFGSVVITVASSTDSTDLASPPAPHLTAARASASHPTRSTSQLPQATPI